jgi:predicted phage baseplate assembly protein
MVRVEPNTMVAVQAVAEIGNYSIAAAAAISGAPPAPGDSISFHCAIDSAGIIQAIDFLPPGAAGDPVVRVIGYSAASGGNPGSLAMEMVHVVDPFWLPDAPIEEPSLLVFTLSGANWQQWTRRPDLDSSTRTDFHFAADLTSGQLTFGDGERGRALPPDAPVFAQYRVTQAGAGNVSANQVTESPLAGIAVANLGPGWGGADQEDLESATGRAAALLYCHDPRSPHPPTNGVNLLDFERMALRVPHTRVARAKAYANLDGRYPCLRAPGTVTVVIIPEMKTPQPTPSAHLLSAVAQYICPRRLVCTQVRVVGPVYVVVSVAAHVAIDADADPGATQAAIVAALNAFLDPLTGGPHGTGWPFGRDVYRTEILQLIAAVDAVDYVTGLTLSGDGAVPGCGNLSVCAGSLVSPGTHRIAIAMEAD